MNLLILCVGILVMYWRTLKYNYLIDDNVKRDGYLYEVPLQAPRAEVKDGKVIPCIYDRQPSKWYRLFMIGMHCVNTSVVYLLWGWQAALLFALHPIGVWGTAWVTGNYYATTTYFCLIAYYFLHTFDSLWACCIAMGLHAAALNSTIEALAFPFILLSFGNLWGLAMLLPLIMFLTGKRFTTGIKIREGFINEQRIKGFSLNRIILMTKVVGRYCWTCLYPDRLGFFGPFGANIHDSQECYDKMHEVNKEFWKSLGVCLGILAVGMWVHPIGTLWFFGFIVLHSQWKIMGQFFALRYLYIALPGLAVIAGTLLANHPFLLAVIATYLAVRTHVYIYTFRNMEAIWQNDLDTWPEHAQCWNNMAQCYMRDQQNGQSLPSWKINLLAAYILKAETMNPGAWEINMNVACFYAIIGQWPMCLKYTDRAIDILGKVAEKPSDPLKMLQAQREMIIKMAEDAVKKPEVGSSFSPENKKEGTENERTITKNTETGIESTGTSQHQGRETGVGAVS